MKRMTYFVMAMAMVLGLAQCKKEQPETPQNEGNSVMITLNVNGDASTGSANKGTRVNVDPNDNPMVTFVEGDKIEVACDGHHVGTLTHNGDNFIGDVTNVTVGQYLYFYFFGNVSPQYFDTSEESCTVYIGDQTGDLPVISMGKSDQLVTSNGRVYSATLQNKCSLMKFNVNTSSPASICINGMNNFVTVQFDRSGNDGFIDGFKYSQVYNGVIKMKGQEGNGTKTYWAIVLPQNPIGVGEAYSYTEDGVNGYIGPRPAIEGIEPNKCYIDGVAMTLSHYDPLGTPLTFEAQEGGAKVTLKSVGTNPLPVHMLANINGGGWSTYYVNTTIILNEGETVMFRGTNTGFAKSPTVYHKFSIDEFSTDEGGYCYVYGNIMSLIDSTGYATLKKLDSSVEYTFESLFAGCEGLCNHPQKTLELPATTLAPYCYSQMFKDCYSLTVAPKLPARNLITGCYKGMFDYTSLEESPVLPATQLASNCYSSMFKDCESLTRITCLATSEMGDNTDNWVSGVNERGTFIKASGASWSTGDSGIPSGWAVENY